MGQATVAKGVVVLFNGFDLSCYLRTIKTGGDADLKDSTPLCAVDAKNYTKGFTDFTASGEGFYSAGAVGTPENVRAVFAAAQATAGNSFLTVGEVGSAPGSPALMMNVLQSKFDVSAKPGDLIMNTFEAKSNKTPGGDAFQEGVWLFYGTANGFVISPTVDLGAAQNGFAAHIQLIDSDDDTQVQIQHSQNGTTWVDLVDNSYGAHEADQPFGVNLTVNRYVRALITPIGTTSKVGIAFKSDYAG